MARKVEPSARTTSTPKSARNTAVSSTKAMTRGRSDQGGQAGVLPVAVTDVADGLDAVLVLVFLELQLGALGDGGDGDALLLLADEGLHLSVGAEGGELGRPGQAWIDRQLEGEATDAGDGVGAAAVRIDDDRVLQGGGRRSEEHTSELQSPLNL